MLAKILGLIIVCHPVKVSEEANGKWMVSYTCIGPRWSIVTNRLSRKITLILCLRLAGYLLNPLRQRDVIGQRSCDHKSSSV